MATTANHGCSMGLASCGHHAPSSARNPSENPEWEEAGSEIPPPLGFGKVPWDTQIPWGEEEAAGTPAPQWVQPSWDPLPAQGCGSWEEGLWDEDHPQKPLPTALGRMLWGIWGARERGHTPQRDTPPTLHPSRVS